MRKWMFGPTALAAALLAVAAVGHAEEGAKAAGTASISGKITAVDGTAAAGVEVRLLPGHAGGKKKNTVEDGGPAPEKKRARPEPLATKTTDDKGAFSFEGLPAGTYIVQAGDRKTKTMGRENVTVTDGQVVSNVAIQLETKAPKAEGKPKKD